MSSSTMDMFQFPPPPVDVEMVPMKTTLPPHLPSTSFEAMSPPKNVPPAKAAEAIKTVQEARESFDRTIKFLVMMVVLLFLMVLIAMGFGIQAWVRTQKFVTWSANIGTVQDNQNRVLLRDDVNVELPVNADTEVARIGMASTGNQFARLRLRVLLEALDQGNVSASGNMSFVGVMGSWTMVGATTSASITFDAIDVMQGENPLIMSNTGPSRVRVIRVEILE